ncbi:cysteine-rich CWC family protein [Parahaliea maris]|uniref:Cysteine-rich CWC family protein n=1 Tax=Parahaliea maris TaxID=2716870 RepID=A0A5C9A9Q4_9GAMM|nr:cysteine-rich CWC family protein [Parahaliea maris]
MKTSESVFYCPVCGRDNQCAVARGGAIESCWCAATPIDHNALAAVPETERGKRCLCPACGRPANNAIPATGRPE